MQIWPSLLFMQVGDNLDSVLYEDANDDDNDKNDRPGDDGTLRSV